jgi:SAM-dependent methyltransferase
MTEHPHHGAQAHQDEAVLVELLDLDAEVLGSYLDQMTGWAAEHARVVPRTVVDVGAGTGTGSRALARRFPASDVVAIDRSALMLERIRAAALEQGLADRLRVVQADLDDAWPAIGPVDGGVDGGVDIVWAALSLHEVTDPDRVFRDIYAALDPGGLLVVIEMDALPRFLPDDVGLGRPGLESRLHGAAGQANGNVHPDWRPHLERAGFAIVEQRTFALEVSPAPSTGRYAHAYLSHLRSALDGRLTAEDRITLDHLLADDNQDGLMRRRDLTVRGSRTAWAARRP